MRSVAMIPFFRESRALTRECLENAGTYADAAIRVGINRHLYSLIRKMRAGIS